MRPENRYGQMTPSERVAFALSEEGKSFLFPWGFTVDGQRYEKMVSGRVARVIDEENRLTEQSYSREECSHIFRTAFLLFAGYVDAATTFAQNCGGGGSAPDQNWGRDKSEDDILWARRGFRKAREMVTTPVIRRGRRTASSIQEASWKIKWTLDRVDLALERMNETKYTVQLDDKSVLEVNDLHRGLISDQKLALEEYKLEQKELFSQYKQDLKSIAAGQGIWLSSKALAVVLVVFELLLVVVGVVVYYWTKSKFI